MVDFIPFRPIFRDFRAAERWKFLRKARPQPSFSKGTLRVLLVDDFGVMREMPRDDVGACVHGKWISARDAATSPGLGGQVPEEREARPSDVSELLQVACPRDIVRRPRRRADVLIEARKRRVETAREPESAEDKRRSTSLTWLTTWRRLHFP